jgi:hypothetical protein
MPRGSPGWSRWPSRSPPAEIDGGAYSSRMPFVYRVKSRAREPQKELTNEQQQRAKAQDIYGCISIA